MSLNAFDCTSAFALATLTLLLSGGMNAAIAAGDPGQGKNIADRVCAGCHREKGTGGPPGFEQIAKNPHYTPQRLRRIMAVPPHRAMPTLQLSQPEIEDLTAYIRSFRDQTNP